jgi:hypothetical protein
VPRNLSKHVNPLFLTSIEARQPALFDFFRPGENQAGGFFFAQFLLEDGGQLFAQRVCPAQCRRTLKQQFEQLPVFIRQVLEVAAQFPQHAFETGILLFAEDLLEFFHFLFAQIVHRGAIEFGDVEPIGRPL